MITLRALKHRSSFWAIQVQALQAQIVFGDLSLPSVWSLCSGAEPRLVAASLNQTLFEVLGFPL